MYCVTVEFQVRPGGMAQFLLRMRRQRDDSLALEPECKDFVIWTGAAQPDIVMLYEVYETPADFDAHLGSAHFRAFDAEIAPLVVGKTVQRWETRE